MTKDLKLDEQYKSSMLLFIRKKLHRTHSTNEVDTQYEATQRIGNARSVLDIGCGAGDLLIKLRLIGFKGRLKGIDKYDIIKEATTSPEIKNMNIELEQMDIEKQTEPNKWDVGVMVSILVFTPEFRDVIKRYSNICKKMIIVDVGPGAYPRLNKDIINEIEKIFNVKHSLLGIGFNIHDTLTELTKYYETINIQKLDDFFKFTNADDVVKYFSTNGKDVWIPKLTESKWKKILAYVKSVAQKEIETKGVWLEPKPYYVITAENPTKTVLPYVTYSHKCSSECTEG